MPITKRIVGSGITKSEIHRTDWSTPEGMAVTRRWREDERHSNDLDYVLNEIEQKATQTLNAAGLPTDGLYNREPDGSWRRVSASEIWAEGEREESESGVTYINGSRFRDATFIVEESGFEPDSPEGYAVRILHHIGLLRSWREASRQEGVPQQGREGGTDRAAVEAMRLGKLLREQELKRDWDAHAVRGEKHIRSTGRPSEFARNVRMAREFRERWPIERGSKSKTALMAEIGAEQIPRLKRSAAIAAVKRGLKNI